MISSHPVQVSEEVELKGTNGLTLTLLTTRSAVVQSFV